MILFQFLLYGTVPDVKHVAIRPVVTGLPQIRYLKFLKKKKKEIKIRTVRITISKGLRVLCMYVRMYERIFS